MGRAIPAAQCTGAPHHASVQHRDAEFLRLGPLTRKLPDRPAATYIYSTRTATTRFVFLDFDAKHHGPEAVKRDVQMASQWLTDAGGRLIVDRSSNGGMHIICPLAPGTSATFAEMKHLVQILSHHLPTLDITPNLNPDTGCLSLPGTLDKQGRHRQLLGTLTAALDAITGGSDPAFLPNLYVNLGILKATHPTPSRPRPPRQLPTARRYRSSSTATATTCAWPRTTACPSRFRPRCCTTPFTVTPPAQPDGPGPPIARPACR